MQMFFKISTNEKRKNQNSIHVLLKKRTIPHTFLKYIFLEKKAIENNQIPEAVLMHEEAHAIQKHSLDVLFVELLQIVFWFNPLIYLTKHRIKLNHEFLADDAVLKGGVNTLDYGKILLDFSQSNFNNQSVSTKVGMANSINYSSIKKRFTVMKKHTSKKSVWLRSLLFLPLIAALVYGFSNKETKEVIIDSENPEILMDIKEKLKKASTLEVNYIQEGDNTTEKEPQQNKKSQKVTPNSYYAGVRFISYKKGLVYTDTIITQGVISDKLYEDLTKAEKKNNPFLSFVPKPKIKKSPTQEEIDELSNPKVFAIWIDGVNVPNSELKKYKPKDFALYSGRAYITKKGRKGKYPQAFWCNFYTHDYFNAKKMGEQETHYSGKIISNFKSYVKMNKKFKE